jgi:hypothetical protein
MTIEIKKAADLLKEFEQHQRIKFNAKNVDTLTDVLAFFVRQMMFQKELYLRTIKESSYIKNAEQNQIIVRTIEEQFDVLFYSVHAIDLMLKGALQDLDLQPDEYIGIHWAVNEKIKEAVRKETQKGLDSMQIESILQTAKDMGLEFDEAKFPFKKSAQ